MLTGLKCEFSWNTYSVLSSRAGWHRGSPFWRQQSPKGTLPKETLFPQGSGGRILSGSVPSHNPTEMSLLFPQVPSGNPRPQRTRSAPASEPAPELSIQNFIASLLAKAIATAKSGEGRSPRSAQS
jgi:hypothetical protein